jgi:hypothetical protein
MTDRELLELAAKAARIAIEWQSGAWAHNNETGCEWNPLTNSGDAFELAAKLAMCVDFMDGRVIAGVMSEVVIDFEDEDYRRAIVRAAAAIGKEMK